MGKKVLVVVDVQNDFVNGGALAYGYPKKDNVAAISTYAAMVKAGGNYVVATRDTHHDNYFDTLEGQLLPVKHCIHETKGWELVDGLDSLAVEGNLDAVFDKPTFGTPLVSEYVRGLLDKEEIDEIEIVGYCLSICVLSNAVLLRSRFPNMKISVIAKLCGDINEESFNSAIVCLRNQQITVR